MATVVVHSPGIPKQSGAAAADRRLHKWDVWAATMAGLQGLVLLAAPRVAVITIGLWWNSNTVAHNFVHRPFFRSRLANRVFALYLSVLLGIPQSLWRDRHLAHHAGRRSRLRITPRLAVEAALVLSLWAALALFRPAFFFTTYVPGYALGLVLCAIQGHYEHARGVTSHYGRIYNFLALNDGYHAEHHANPSRHWTQLPDRIAGNSHTSGWPAALRWMDSISTGNFILESLERIVLRSPRLQRTVLTSHRRAFHALLSRTAPPERVLIVGGGLFPRSALILRELLPDAHLTLLDAAAANLAAARAFLGSHAVDGIDFVHGAWPAAMTPSARGFDLVVFPLCFRGDRAALYRHPPAAAVLIHDWIWRPRGNSVMVSRILAKRLNLVTPCAP